MPDIPAGIQGLELEALDFRAPCVSAPGGSFELVWGFAFVCRSTPKQGSVKTSVYSGSELE